MGQTVITLTASPIGENAIIFYLPEPLQDSYPFILNQLAEHLHSIDVIDCVVAYCSVMVVFDPDKHQPEQLTKQLRDYLPKAINHAQNTQSPRVIHIPVCYDTSLGFDLEDVAKRADLTTAEVIRYHTEKIYTVCCLGFIPGFAFLGYVDDVIATPRRPDPRAKVPAGSVGIAGQQTGVYPADSPGGWNIVGRTPMTLYAPEKNLYSRFEMADSVQFYAISLDEFNAWDTSDD